MSKIQKPQNVSDDRFMSAKWDEIVDGRNFKASDIPNIVLLCTWHRIVSKCMEDLTSSGDLQVAYSNNLDDIKELPQIGTMKKATDAIRALNKQLKIEDEVQDTPKAQITQLTLIQGKYKQGGKVVNG